LRQRVKAEMLLVVITLIWGSTFVVVKDALNDASPLMFISLRFIAAGLLLFALLSRGRMRRASLLPGLVLGLFLFGGFAFQTSGLNFTTPSKAAFITGFSVILVPLFSVFAGHRLHASNLAGALLGMAGLYFLVLPPHLTGVNRGDVLVLFCAICFAIHILLVGVYARHHPFQDLVTIQVFTCGVLATLLLPLEPGRRLHVSGGLLVALGITAVLATGVAFAVQNWAQKYTPAAHTALIFALEPVFAALTSLLVLGERLGAKALLGCGLVLAGMVVSEVWGASPPTPVEG
jgi:drug/metabolite transporter (DMT)-like permease